MDAKWTAIMIKMFAIVYTFVSRCTLSSCLLLFADGAFWDLACREATGSHNLHLTQEMPESLRQRSRKRPNTDRSGGRSSLIFVLKGRCWLNSHVFVTKTYSGLMWMHIEFHNELTQSTPAAILSCISSWIMWVRRPQKSTISWWFTGEEKEWLFLLCLVLCVDRWWALTAWTMNQNPSTTFLISTVRCHLTGQRRTTHPTLTTSITPTPTWLYSTTCEGKGMHL